MPSEPASTRTECVPSLKVTATAEPASRPETTNPVAAAWAGVRMPEGGSLTTRETAGAASAIVSMVRPKGPEVPVGWPAASVPEGGEAVAAVRQGREDDAPVAEGIDGCDHRARNARRVVGDRDGSVGRARAAQGGVASAVMPSPGTRCRPKAVMTGGTGCGVPPTATSRGGEDRVARLPARSAMSEPGRGRASACRCPKRPTTVTR